MEEPQTRRAGNPQDWGSSGSWPEPRQARAGPSLSSVLSELPSAATVRYRGPGVLPWGGVEEEGEEEDRSFQALAEAAHQEQQDVLPSRELPWPMQARRAHRKSQARGQAAQASGSRVTHWTLQLRRSKEKFQRALQAAKPWAWTLKKIGGQFGAGTASYFSLLRFLLALNILASLLSVCMALLPTWLEGPPPPPPDTHNSTCGHYDPHLQGLVSFPSQLFSLLSGEGFLERSPLFYGFFPPRPRLAITYLSRTFAGGLLSLLLILHRSVSGLKQTLLAESGALTSYSHRVFSAWDFGLCGQVHVQLRRRQILGELKLELEEADVRRRAAVRTLGQQVWVWSVRALLNLLVCGLLAAAFYGVYWATGASVQLQEASIVQKAPLLKLVVDFLPSIFVSGVNFVLPPVFKLLAPLEGYTQSHQVIFILLRTVFLRLASLVMLLVSLWSQITCGGDAEAPACKTCGYNYEELPCWETRIGQEMYKLLLFDLLTGLAVTLLIQFPRKLLCSNLCPKVAAQEFQVPDEVLGLIYAQTVVWVGSFFCPLLPLLNTVKFLLLFYLKKLTLFSTCSPAARTFRASAASFFFPLVLLLGLAVSAVPVLYSIFLIPPSKLCGPFRGQESIWAQIPESIRGLSQTSQDFLFFLGTQAFAVPLLLLSSILMAYTVALANSHGRLISELKKQIETESQNKVFLARRAVALSSAQAL
ncbi:transmembrane channel-like protein 4 isoform X4 [Erinaceus europaeus]|uniref:Transmembrane channel-like protein n=1 Tax=Erinaceus europaeus TaxID=9365 RepID=A0A1S3AQ41_ERIEU|nr:transmembrane channel-like protein 4 isoform X4 [Erinaceus europaeus]